MTRSTDKARDVAGAKEIIRRAGLRSTGARIAVLGLLEKATRPMSHQEVSEALQALGFDHATIYRNLMDLTEAGLLVRGDLGDHVWRFELRREGEDHKSRHPHFVCTDCGEVACLPDQTVSVKAAAGAPRALRQQKVAVQLQGVCDTCEDA